MGEPGCGNPQLWGTNGAKRVRIKTPPCLPICGKTGKNAGKEITTRRPPPAARGALPPASAAKGAPGARKAWAARPPHQSPDRGKNSPFGDRKSHGPPGHAPALRNVQTRPFGRAWPTAPGGDGGPGAPRWRPTLPGSRVGGPGRCVAKAGGACHLGSFMCGPTGKAQNVGCWAESGRARRFRGPECEGPWAVGPLPGRGGPHPEVSSPTGGHPKPPKTLAIE